MNLHIFRENNVTCIGMDPRQKDSLLEEEHRQDTPWVSHYLSSKTAYLQKNIDKKHLG